VNLIRMGPLNWTRSIETRSPQRIALHNNRIRTGTPFQ